MTAPSTDRAGRTPLERLVDFIERLRAGVGFDPRQRELPLSQPGSNQ